MSKNLPCIKLDDNAINGLRDYFFNNYNGEEFPLILKGRFYIEVFDDRKHSFKILVEQGTEDTSLTLLSEKGEIIIEKTILYGNKLKYDEKKHSYITTSSIEISCKEFKRIFIMFEKEVTDIFSYVAVFFNKEKNTIPYKVFSYTKGKKKNIKKSLRIYSISKEFIDQKSKPGFTILEYNDLNIQTQIKTSIFFTENLEKIMDEENMSYTQPLFIPFKEFMFCLKKDVAEVYCNVNEEKKILECVIYKTKMKIFALEISLEKDPNRNFKIYTFDEFESFKNDDKATPFTIAKDLIHLMVVNFFYFTHYKIILNKTEKETEIVTKKINSAITNNKNSNYSSKNVYLNLNAKKRIYSIDSSVKENVARRKKPEYKKFSWQVRGHFRHLKSGKKVWIAPYSCNRKKKSETINSKNTNYIIKL